MTHPLPKPLRTQLETAVKAAREVAETAAGAVLARLGVAEARVPEYLDVDQKLLRRRLRAHAQALGDRREEDGRQALTRLIWEVAYEHWHRMLFARFLAENGLLLWEPGAPLSLEECREIVDHDPAMAMGARSAWELAGMLAARMLPQIFRPQNPVYALAFAPEHQQKLEQLLAGLPAEVFVASDSLGWVYQFWQAKRKQQVNDAEVKIGADELPAVTQLFTEPYMVDFLLHNSLGAWWVTRHPERPCPVPLPYLRRLDDGTPAAGRFEGWPDHLADFRLLDPCCGSGHFLVAAFLLLVPMRQAAEGLSAAAAVDAVLRENLHGLELDPRCVEIAVFALALAAWRYPDEQGRPLGVRAGMPVPQVACCGLKVSASAEDWMALVPDGTPRAAYLRQELGRLHAAFAQAPLLGSLLDPARTLKQDLASSNLDTLRQLLALALAGEAEPEAQPERWEQALRAQGLLETARLLEARYHLVVTNVPYLARGKQSDALKDYCATHYADAKNDLANVFLERCLELTYSPLPAGEGSGVRAEGAEGRPAAGVVQVVMPQNWLFLSSYKKQRESLLKRVQWNLLARLGPGAFETISGEIVQAVLLTQTRAPAAADFQLRGVDAGAPKVVQDKAALLQVGDVVSVSQKGQLANSDSRVALLGADASVHRLEQYATSSHGQGTFDRSRFVQLFWERSGNGAGWEFHQDTPARSQHFDGCCYSLRWEGGNGQLAQMMADKEESGYSSGKWRAGVQLWGSRGVLVGLVRPMPVSRYLGGAFDANTAALIPREPSLLSAIWAFCESGVLTESVREVHTSLYVPPHALLHAAFDAEHWQQVAAERYPNGLPKPYSDDPTQWLFHGHPQPATDPLQVAVARLAGYRWPAETDAQMELADEARRWIAACEALQAHTDDDGILCLPSVRGEPPAHERLLKLLIDAWNVPDSAAASGSGVQPGGWKPAVLDKLLADADCAGKGLDVWLRDKFFEQHCKRFHHRPFIWHLWDGLKDGFAALVNYHRLDAKTLERLIHTYLGDWIRQQEAGLRAGIDGAQTRLAAAQDLKRRLELILEGEKPYDIYVRWKPLAEQPIGWNPDLNDGVRLNIRPFVKAEVLRHCKKPKLNIHWDKDRGKDVESAPWFKVFHGERINDHHLTLAEKRAARGAKSP